KLCPCGTTSVTPSAVSPMTPQVVNRFAFPSTHPMKPPYVVKPLREGSSFGVVIVTEDQAHPPQIVSAPEWRECEEVIVER
ncbi:D-alanine--D-alanine ligase, partial [Rhizobium ruizarguesonis]